MVTCQTILSYDHSSRTAFLPGSNGRITSATVKDVRPSFCDSLLAEAVQQAIDYREESLGTTIVEIPDNVDMQTLPRDLLIQHSR